VVFGMRGFVCHVRIDICPYRHLSVSTFARIDICPYRHVAQSIYCEYLHQHKPVHIGARKLPCKIERQSVHLHTHNMAPARKRKARGLPVEDPPVEDPPVEYFQFNSDSPLSNFHESKINVIVDTLECRTGQHMFERKKYVCAARAAYFNRDTVREKDLTEYADRFSFKSDLYETAQAAKLAGGKEGELVLTTRELDFWNKSGAECAQIQICIYKRENDKSVRNALWSSVGKDLLCQDKRANSTTVWGARIKRRTGAVIGLNKLGKLWMDKRADMVTEDEAFQAECKRLKTELFGE
jgi:hypothetical protein